MSPRRESSRPRPPGTPSGARRRTSEASERLAARPGHHRRLRRTLRRPAPRGLGDPPGAGLAHRLGARLAAPQGGVRDRHPAAPQAGDRRRLVEHHPFFRRRPRRPARVRLSEDRGDGDLPLLDGHPRGHRARDQPLAGGARGRCDAQGAAEAGAGSARDASLADPPPQHGAGDRGRSGDHSGGAGLLPPAGPDRGAGRLHRPAGARPARHGRGHREAVGRPAVRKLAVAAWCAGAVLLAAGGGIASGSSTPRNDAMTSGIASGSSTPRNDGGRGAGMATVRRAVAHDRSPPLALLFRASRPGPAPSAAEPAAQAPAPIVPPVLTAPPGAAAIAQTSPGTNPPAAPVASFDGLGAGFTGPQGSAAFRNPSDNTLAVGRDHIVQIVNSRMAVYTKRGRRYDTTGKVLYGPVPTNNLFRGFGGPCELRNNGDAVARYDQLAARWLIVMPIFRRGPARPEEIGRAH